MANSDKFITVSQGAGTVPANQPPTCPKCGSRDTSSAAKRPTSNSYWRCLKCGDVWNPSQLSGGSGKWWQR
jgi:transposase-like protein